MIVQNRERLLALKNRPVLTNIETSIFALSLDTHTLPAQATEDPLIRPSLDAHVQNCASGLAGRNRWFDKALSVIVETNGRAGMMGEHSPCDALIPSVIVDYVVAEPVVDSAFSPVQSSGGWKRLEWKVDQELETEIKQCEERNWKIIEDSDASQLWWSEYGADWIKKTGKGPLFGCSSPTDNHFQPSSLLTRIFRWLFNSHGTKTKGTFQQRTKQLQPVASCMGEQTSSEHSAKTALRLLKRCWTSRAQSVILTSNY